MHSAVGHRNFVTQAISHLRDQLNAPNTAIASSISAAYGTSDAAAIEAHRVALHGQMLDLSTKITAEADHGDVDYVSRVDAVGLFQSALSKVFADIPALQGYGDRNPIWAVTWIEEAVHNIGAFFSRTYADVHGQHKPLFTSILQELKGLGSTRAPYPPGVPQTMRLDESFDKPIALLADWGGDNPASRKIAAVALANKPAWTIHLGDIYYGGTQYECQEFLKLWPIQADSKNLGTIPEHTSLALNGNHEMYSGGAAYFGTVLPAFHQTQPFFCLEGDYWRVIGLDTAYMGGRLKPQSEADSAMQVQWDWLVNLLTTGPKRANILLTHHQPVSAHHQEFSDSRALWTDVQELLNMPGIGQDAIFGWFFGHEHRCAIYKNESTPFNARLIGNGCIPHEVQTEVAADTGCTPVIAFNKRALAPFVPNAAVSSFALLRFVGPDLQIVYLNEDDGMSFGSETWYSQKGRLASEFVEADQIKQTPPPTTPSNH